MPVDHNQVRHQALAVLAHQIACGIAGASNVEASGLHANRLDVEIIWHCFQFMRGDGFHELFADKDGTGA